MGWLWSSNSKPAEVPTSQITPPTNPSTQTPPSRPPQPKPQSAEDAELQKFMEFFKAEEAAAAAASSRANGDSQQHTGPKPSPLPEWLAKMWNAVYRYGEMRSCTDKWDDFWFCMRHKSASGPVKEDLVRTHHRNREHAKYYAPGRPSSEDVWEARAEKVAPDTVFAERIDVPTMGDEEWREMESERRQRIRDGLGFDKSS
ncbi:hypothetical protein LLEC1_03354 [Akanthomyces lecanii]|uniref:Uncharacterized protein n=1 Tax=Cordyceps confragosa TaxID=2714763 RepID=A0A179IH93_CORDF|nr:hypothetical protein LLEC1_03354 [Akanthomyces lecanii]